MISLVVVPCLMYALAGRAAQSPAASLQSAPDSVSARLDATADRVLAGTGVRGAAIAIVRGGRIVHVAGHGFADKAADIPVTSRTIFNAGSISKSLTAWGIGHLIDAGAVVLDAPASRYLKRWHLPPSKFPDSLVTIRRLLSHTAGLSKPSVEELPFTRGNGADVVASLNDPSDPVRITRMPGEGFQYSGGGYGVLQLVIEEVSGKPFAEYVKTTVLEPLGMHSSSMDPPWNRLADLAQPYDGGRPITLHRYGSDAAAGLYTTAEDLARFIVAHFDGPSGEPRGRGVLRPETLTLLMTEALDPQEFLNQGLGYDLWPMTDAVNGSTERGAGHMGQNIGWAGVYWLRPSTGDGLVVLTNDSRGMEAHRLVLCAWVATVAKPWGGPFCRPAVQNVAPTSVAHDSPRSLSTRDSVRIDSVMHAYFPDSAPGAAVAITLGDKVAFQGAYGLADLATRRAVRQSTPFYLASVSKPITAMAVQLLVREGKLHYDDRITRILPELGGVDSATTVAHLLAHTSGLPDYYQYVQWGKVHALSNPLVMSLVRDHPKALFPPGSRYAYSNSEYVLLSEIVARRARMPFSTFVRQRILAPLGMTETFIYDDTTVALGSIARGYLTDGARFRLADQDTIEFADGSKVYIPMTTTGAGGVFSTTRDLLKLDSALTHGVLRPAEQRLALGVAAATPQEYGVRRVSGVGYGWYVGQRYGQPVYWHDGSHGGRKAMFIRVPQRGIALVLLANRGDIDVVNLATALLDAVMEPQQPVTTRAGRS